MGSNLHQTLWWDPLTLTQQSEQVSMGYPALCCGGGDEHTLPPVVLPDGKNGGEQRRRVFTHHTLHQLCTICIHKIPEMGQGSRSGQVTRPRKRVEVVSWPEFFVG